MCIKNIPFCIYKHIDKYYIYTTVIQHLKPEFDMNLNPVASMGDGFLFTANITHNTFSKNKSAGFVEETAPFTPCWYV